MCRSPAVVAVGYHGNSARASAGARPHDPDLWDTIEAAPAQAPRRPSGTPTTQRLVSGLLTAAHLLLHCSLLIPHNQMLWRRAVGIAASCVPTGSNRAGAASGLRDSVNAAGRRHAQGDASTGGAGHGPHVTGLRRTMGQARCDSGAGMRKGTPYGWRSGAHVC